VSVNGSGSSSYTATFGLTVPASAASPLGGGSITSASQIRFSMDVKPIGSVSQTPVTVGVNQYDSQYEVKHAIDANQDGDMSDGATNYASEFPPPTLVEGAYTHVSFTMNEGTQTAGAIRISPFPTTQFPLTPEFDPTVPLEIDVSL
jgi:hypothetical protein